ncbi:MAG TPA: ABC transporter ATP-binding protein [Candidatus Saccharimonadales bacterium]|nr:ABC transporter ATP-binding protein [Candidatus Saccharimonadales bacterium]
MSAVRPAEPELALEARNLRKRYWGHLRLRRYDVLNGLSLSVRRGEIFGLLGQNGAGKTTAIKIILGLIFPDSGSVRILGRKNSVAAVRERIGFLPENPYFYEYLTAREFLDYIGRLFGFSAEERLQRIDAILDRVGMSERADVQLRKFSKGMVQRIGLAQALINDPDFVILDEPMSGLDPIGRREFRDIILSLRERGKTVFFSSHILSDAEALCDRVGIVHGGVLGAEGRIEDLLRPTVRFWELTFSGPAFDALPGASGDVLAVRGPETLVRIHSEPDLAAMLEVLRQAGAKLISVVPRRDTLEDLYLKEVSGG